MNRYLVVLVVSLIVASVTATDPRDNPKKIRESNNNSLVIYRTVANNTNGNVVTSSGVDDLILFSYNIQFRELNCDVISGTTDLGIPSWTEHKFEIATESVLVNDYSNERHTYIDNTLEQIDAIKRTRIVMSRRSVDTVPGGPLVSTYKANDSLSFYALLSTPSPKNKTESRFYRTSNDGDLKETIETVGLYNYYKNVELGAKFLNLPLLFENASLTIVVPDEIDGLHKLEEQVEKVLETPNYEKSLVSISLPIFSIHSKVDLEQVLDKNKTSRHRFMHETVISLGKDRVKKSNIISVGSSPPEEFKANRPFIFYVKANDVIMIIGRVLSPEYVDYPRKTHWFPDGVTRN